MIKIAVSFPPEPSLALTLMRQCGVDYAVCHNSPQAIPGATADEQWENLRYFLERTVPVAEKAGVKMAMHPDDPPLSPIRGVARIMYSE